MATTLSDFKDNELSILCAISEAGPDYERLTQRDLAGRAGVSLGMANILLRRLAERGWVKLTRLSTKTVRYALTPEGMNELARRTAGYFTRASRNAELYRDKLEAFVLKAKRDGASTLVLLGTSDVDFLLAYICERHDIVFVKSSDLERAQALGRKPGVKLLLATGLEGAASDTASLTDIIVGSMSEGEAR